MASDKYDIGTGFIEATRYCTISKSPRLKGFWLTPANGIIRLGFQHYLWKETLDYLVHPSIPVHQEQFKIADVGTGTR